MDENSVKVAQHISNMPVNMRVRRSRIKRTIRPGAAVFFRVLAVAVAFFSATGSDVVSDSRVPDGIVAVSLSSIPGSKPKWSETILLCCIGVFVNRLRDICSIYMYKDTKIVVYIAIYATILRVVKLNWSCHRF